MGVAGGGVGLETTGLGVAGRGSGMGSGTLPSRKLVIVWSTFCVRTGDGDEVVWCYDLDKLRYIYLYSIYVYVCESFSFNTQFILQN